MYTPGEFGKRIPVSVKTLQRWDRQGALRAHRTPTNRRYYTTADLESILPQAAKAGRRTVASCRVSSAAQKPDLENQQRLLEGMRRKQGTVNLAEKLRFVEKAQASSPTKKRKRRKQVICDQVKILGATVSCEAGRWYVSMQVEIKKPLPQIPEPVVGVDVGVKTAAVVSDGRRLESQKPLALHLKKLSKKQKTKDPETGRTGHSSIAPISVWPVGW
jgi:DNA-binding transcriptional MerR regulator